MPSHISRVEPLRPLCPSCTPIAVPGACACTKSVIRFHASACRPVYRPAQPGVMRPSSLTHTISVITSPAPPRALAPRWTRWKSPGTPSVAEYMSIGETTTRLRRVRPQQPERGEHRGRAGRAAELALDGAGEAGRPRSRRFSWVTRRLRVSRLKANWRGGWPRYRERSSNHSRLARAAPLGGGDDGAPLGLVGGECLGERRLFLQAGGEREGVLHGELGAGADGEVGVVGGVADQDGVAVRPAFVDHRAEGGPGRLVGPQRPAAEGVGEDLGAACGGLGFVQFVEAGRPPDLLAHLDDDGRRVGRVRVTVQLHHAVLGLGDLEAEGVEGEVGGQPDVTAAVAGEGGPEHLAMGLAGGAVHPVGRDDEVVLLREPSRVRGLGAEAQLDAEGVAALVQDLQEAAAAEGGEAVSSGGLAGASVDDVDVVPADEVGLEGPRRPPGRRVRCRPGSRRRGRRRSRRCRRGRCVPRR